MQEISLFNDVKNDTSLDDLLDVLKKNLNPSQYEAATHKEGPAAIMAGAGSGKTHTLMSRVSFLVASGVKPQQILMLTFTNAAANEMKTRAAKLLDERCEKIHASTYHSFCTRILREHGKVIGINDFTILSFIDGVNLINYVKSEDPSYSKLKGFPSSDTVAKLMSTMINTGKDLEDILENDKYLCKYLPYTKEILKLMDMVREYSYKERKFNYDDLLVYTNDLLDNKELCKKIACGYKYIMIDEFQDTNNLQEEIILKMAKYNDNIVVVGDISQSIYAFRGANVRHLQDFHTKLQGCKTYVLDYNYRSTQEILDTANCVMQNNVETWEYYDMIAPTKRGDEPKILSVHDSTEEAEKILSDITTLHGSGMPYKEMAVFSRASSRTAQLEMLLRQYGIPYEKRGGLKFFEHAAIADMLAYMSVVREPHDVINWYRLLQIYPNIGPRNAKKIADKCTEPNLAGPYEFLIDKAFSRYKYFGELELIRSKMLEFKQYDTIMALFKRVEDHYFAVRQRCCDDGNLNNDTREKMLLSLENDKKTVGILKELASKYTEFTDFMDDVKLDNTPEDKKNEDCVVISTIHSAKGLEWEFVVIMDCCDGLFPMSYSDNLEEDEEELRCFYVAMTRAKKILHMYIPKYRIFGSRSEELEMSHFLERALNNGAHYVPKAH